MGTAETFNILEVVEWTDEERLAAVALIIRTTMRKAGALSTREIVNRLDVARCVAENSWETIEHNRETVLACAGAGVRELGG